MWDTRLRENCDKITHPWLTDNAFIEQLLTLGNETFVYCLKTMENPQNPYVNRTERNENRVEDLHLDRVVASQPEIGPTPPDGGYGWLIVISAIIYNITIPSLLSLYGLIILKAIIDEDRSEDESLKVWDIDVALVPVIMVVIRLLLESWCRAMVKIFNMPRFMALAGLCLTVAGVLLSSYSTDVASNDHIVNIFSGIFTGAGCALTGQQTEIIIIHYFRDKLIIAQRLLRMAPTIGNCLMPLLIGYMCTIYTSDAVVMIYGAILMQNCFFLAAYTRPIYIETVIRHTYNMIRDAVEDEDEVIFSNQSRPNGGQETQNPVHNTVLTTSQEDDNQDVVVFNSRLNAEEILDPAVQYREKASSKVATPSRFSSDFSTMYGNNQNNRFSSDFGTLEITSYSRISGYQELESIERERVPQPLYRETTVDAPQNNLVFTTEMTPGSVRRTASLKKNVITVFNMLMDLNFYLYALLHLCTTYSILVLGFVFPPMIWEQNPSETIWTISTLLSVAHGSALCFVLLSVLLPRGVHEKARLFAAFCLCGAVGFYGITLSSNKSFLIIWCIFASFSTATAAILHQPSTSSFNEFDTTATLTTTNTLVATLIMIWMVVFNYEYKTCFWIASALQIATSFAFFVSSFRRRR